MENYRMKIDKMSHDVYSGSDDPETEINTAEALLEITHLDIVKKSN